MIARFILGSLVALSVCGKGIDTTDIVAIDGTG